MRRNDVASTSFRHRVPTRFLINQCQIITFLILKYDIIENSRIELRGIVLPVQVGGLLGGGPKGMLAPPLKLLGGPGPPWPPLFLRLCSVSLITRPTLRSIIHLRPQNYIPWPGCSKLTTSLVNVSLKFQTLISQICHCFFFFFFFLLK